MAKLRVWGLALAFLWSQSLLAEVIDVTIHYVGPTQGSAWLGMQQGMSEANIQGEFLGQKYTIKTVTAKELESADNLTAILVAEDAETVINLRESEKFNSVPVFNLTSDDDNLRAACFTNLLNIPASAQMKQDALKQWMAKNPESKAHVQGWHEDFKKFAASQLNIRFKKAHGVIMDDDAWAGWAAVKLISDTVARIQGKDATKILNYLKMR